MSSIDPIKLIQVGIGWSELIKSDALGLRLGSDDAIRCVLIAAELLKKEHPHPEKLFTLAQEAEAVVEFCGDILGEC